MPRSLKFAFPFVFGALTLISRLHAIQWTGAANNELTNSNNWDTMTVPTVGDVAKFPPGSVPTNPILNPGETFQVTQASFPSGSQPYSFTINGSNAANSTMIFGSSPSSGIGVSNNVFPIVDQTFTASGGSGNFAGTINFLGTSSADSLNTGHVIYQIGDNLGQGTINFLDSSTAGGTSGSPQGGQITVGDYLNGSGTGGQIHFTQTATAGYSTIQIGDTSTNSIGTFTGTSSTVFPTADHATISVGNINGAASGTLNFGNFATAGASTITVGDFNAASVVNFNTNSTAGGTSLNPGSQITVGDFPGTNGSLGALNFNDSTTAAYAIIRVGNTTLSSVNSSTTLSAANQVNAPFGGPGLITSTVNFNGTTSTTFSTADHANITVGDFGDDFFGSFGILNFNGFATAANSKINVGDVGNASVLNFNDNSTAGLSGITIGSSSNNTSGTANFNTSATAAGAAIGVENGSLLIFNDATTASNSVITSFNSEIDFNGTSTAGTAQIGLTDNQMFFNDSSTASNAEITASKSLTVFLVTSTAENAQFTFTNGSELVFDNNATAANAQINLDLGASAEFYTNATAANAVIVANNNSVVDFNNNSLGGTASIALKNNSALTLGQFDAPVTSLTISSLTADATSTVDLYGAAFTVNYNGATPITVAGVISDVGDGSTSLGSPFTKSGTGTLVLSGANTYSGLTTVSQGNLVLNGSIFGDAQVNLGAILSGIGSVGGNTTVNGSIAPGNSIGTLNVAGNYTQNVGSTYFLEINGLGQSDLINVTGAATLNGGQVVVTTLDGGVETTTPYTILTATGGVTGQFAGVTTTNLLLTPLLTYDANNAYLSFSQIVFSFDAVTPNQIAVATQLEGITDPTVEEFLILTTLAALPAADQQRALSEMSGEQYAVLNLAAEIAGRQFIRRLYDPLRSIVTTEPCYDPCSCEVPCPTLDFWLEGGGGQTFLDGNANAHGLKLNSWEVTAGVQSTFNRDWTVGIAGTYIEDQIKYDIGGTGKNRMGFGAFYGLYRPSNFYVLADAAFGGGEFTVNRNIDIGVLAYSAKGRPKHFQAIGYIEGGFDWNTCNFLIQPFLGFEGGYFRRNTFSETGTSPLNLNINKQAYGQFFSRLGVHLTTEQWSSVKLSVDVAWDCRLSSLKHNVTEQFQSFGNSFVISGVPGNRNSVDAAATITTKLCGGWELYAEVGGEFWSKVSTYNVLGGVKYSW